MLTRRGAARRRAFLAAPLAYRGVNMRDGTRAVLTRYRLSA